jgi:hypothetical protein
MEKKKTQFRQIPPLPPKIPHGQIFVGRQDIDAFYFLIN